MQYIIQEASEYQKNYPDERKGTLVRKGGCVLKKKVQNVDSSWVYNVISILLNVS